MKSSNHPFSNLSTVLGGMLFAAVSAGAAIEWQGIQFGGFVSQGYLVNSGSNDYLGETSEGTFDFREYAVNASYATGAFRFGAQVFGQRLGEYGEDKPDLDWATVDYQPKSWLGFRAGRVKTPRGLYNEALDVDSIRPFVLLPQSVYDARLRDFNASFDGGMIFGNVGLGKVGSLDYKVYGGEIPMSLDSGANDYFNNDVPYLNARIGMDSAWGSSLFWNTPVDGLRLGYSFSVFRGFGADREVPFDPALPPLLLYKVADNYYRHLLSAEYWWDSWVFAAEVGRDIADYGIGLANTRGMDLTSLAARSTHGYVSAARRLSDKVEIGFYYSYSKETSRLAEGSPGGLEIPDLVQHDYAFSVRYDITRSWLVKGELHYLDQAGKLFDTPSHPQPVAQRDNSWILFALKTTYSF